MSEHQLILKTTWHENLEKSKQALNNSIFRAIKICIQKAKAKFVSDWRKSETIDAAITNAKAEYLAKSQYINFYK